MTLAHKALHILLVTDAWHPQVNGVVRTFEMTIRELQAQGHRISVLGPDSFRTVPLPTYPEIRLALVSPFRISRMIDELQPDAIHIATEGPLGWAARRYCRRRHYQFTTSYHTRFPEYIAQRLPLPLGVGYAFVRRFHRPSASTMVATRSVTDSLQQRGFRNVHPWTRGVDTELFQPYGREALDYPRPILLSVGRVAVEKNLEAFLALDVPGTKVVVGDGPQRAALERTFPNAIFLGTQTGEQLARIYAAADVFVFPSRTDTFGLVILEALACGVPVAAFPVSGPMDVLATQDDAAPVGVLDEDLGTAIAAALTIPSARCRDFALAHSWHAATDEFLGNLRQIH